MDTYGQSGQIMFAIFVQKMDTYGPGHIWSSQGVMSKLRLHLQKGVLPGAASKKQLEGNEASNVAESVSTVDDRHG